MRRNGQTIITSPYSPDLYPSNVDCNWLLLAPQGYRLGISFEYFRTSSSDKLKIYDGSTSYFTRIGEFSGHQSPSDILSSTESLYLEFKSDSRRGKKGFKIEYRKHKGITKLQYKRIILIFRFN